MTAIPVTPSPVTPSPVTPIPETPSPVTPISLEPIPPGPVTAQSVEPRSALTAAPAHIPLARIVSVELRKSFDTRSGFWLLASIGIASVLATAGVVIWAARDQLTYSTFTLAIGFPMAVILPIIAILSVTAEWSQRSGLTTFTLVPHRGRVVFAKAIVAISIAVASMLLAFVIGAVGNLVAAALAGRDAVWDQGVATLAAIVLANVLIVLLGFMLGVLIRNSTAAIVAYFVYAFVAPPLLELLAANQQWFHDLHAWVDPNVTQQLLFHGPLAGQQWIQLAVTTAVWLVAPLLLGLWTLQRSEVK
jgi:ABC-2 type transport system permease protein